MRTIILSILLIILTYSPSISQEHNYRLKSILGQSLSAPGDIAIDKNDNIYVADGWSLKIFNPEGKIIKEHVFDDGSAKYASSGYGVVLDNKGHFFIIREDKKVYKYTLEGDIVMSFGGSGTAPGLFRQPSDIALDNLGNIYVSDLESHQIQKFDSEGNLLQTFGGYGTEKGKLYEPKAIKIDSEYNIYIAERNRFQRFKPDGSPDLLIDKEGPQDIAIDSSGNFYLSYWARRYVKKFDTHGDLLNTYFEHSPKEGNLYAVYVRIEIDSKGNFYTIELNYTSEHNRIQKFSPNMDFLFSFGNAGKGTNSLVEANNQMEFDSEGNFYIISENQVKLLNKYGDYILSFGWLGDKDGLRPIRDIALDKYGDIYILTFDSKGIVHKFSSTGDYINSFHKDLTNPESNFSPTRITFDGKNNMYLIEGAKCYKFDYKQNLISKFTLDVDNTNGYIVPIRDLTVDNAGLIYLVQNSNIKILSPQGKFIKQFNALDKSPEKWEEISSIAVDSKNFIYAVDKLTIRKFDEEGNLVTTIPGSRQFNIPLNSKISVKPDGSEIRVGLDSKDYLKTVKSYSNGSTPLINTISGTIYNDINSNCIQDNESGLGGILIETLPGPYYTRTNSNGKFSIDVGIGEYTVKQIVHNIKGQLIEQICPDAIENHKVAFSSEGNINSKINFGNKVTLSPYLTANVSSTRRRRCFESTTKVTYANSGFAPAHNAEVYVRLPKEVELLSADKPYTQLPNGTYVFTVGTIAPGQTSVITIQDKVKCGDESVRGLTVCTKAWISAGKLPEKPIATVTGECDPETGKVRFVIRNNGPEDMETGELFRIYRDGKLSTVEQYKLASGDSLVLWVTALGKTIRLEADQPDGNGDNTLESETIEGCQVGGSDVPISMGFVNVLPTGDEEPDAAEECLLITDSFDPNDKQVTPTGLTTENYTPTGVALKYKIRFQNTGTDVAYRVVVVDTLSENLDISTLQVGSASHNYRFDVSGKGKPVLTWTFDNIMLPDSNRNEPGSHGYIQFSIKPKADLPEKTLVENFADIFFDFNSPVRTNITANRIYDMPEVISEADKLDAEEIIATPGITSFAPESGKFGTEVIVNGKKFSSDPALNKVFFNGLPATIVSASETELKVIVPANATSGNLRIQTNDGVTQSTDGFEVYQPPVVSSFSPMEGVVGTTVTLQGKHLTEEWLQTIKLGDQTCEIISRESNSVVIKVPEGATTATFEAISKGGEAQTIDAFVVWHQPVISKLSKPMGKVGATIEIMGINFAPVAERNQVMFGKVKAQVLQATSSVLMVQVPKGAENGPVTIETPGGLAESPDHFTFIPAPEVLTFTPAIGMVGTDVTLTGINFLTLGEQDTISFNGQKAIVLEATPTLLKVRVPRGASTGKIKVAGIGGYAVTVDDFRIEELSPEQAIEVYPNPTNGNFTIRFMHADFEVQQVQLFSAVGQLIYSEKVASPRPDKLDIKLSSPKSGIYILHIKTERGLVVKKLHVL